MNNIQYKLCDKTYREQLQKFISENWKYNHILATNKKLLDWQYMNKNGDYNFVLALDSEKIIGILGFIPSDFFHEHINVKKYECCLALWSIKKNSNIAGLGIGMIQYLKKFFNLNFIYTLGLSDDAIQIYNALKYSVCQLQHFIKINQEKKQFEILKNYEDLNINYSSINNKNYFLSEVNSLNELKLIFLNLPNEYQNLRKDFIYLKNRYYKHPFYKYRFMLISKKKPECIIVMREVTYKSSTALRIIDCIGNISAISFISSFLDRILSDENHEYIDLLQFGINKQVLHKAGFFGINDLNTLVVPNNFEPFEQKNKKIYFAFKDYNKETQDYKIYLFKGDGDQDRPNRVNAE
jgi:hypothetical protein